MSKSKSVTIHIPHPCTQRWDEMTPNDKGRHCMHCRETVIDFTTWSDIELYNFFQDNRGSVCGRLLPTQLDHPISIPYQPHSRLYRLTVALGLTLLFTQTPELLAQQRPPKTEQSAFTKNADTTGNGLGSISGTVLDEKKEPMINAVVELFQDSVLKGGTITDHDGKYFFRNLAPGTYNVLVLYVGYDSLIKTDIRISASNHSKINLNLTSKMKRHLTTGLIIINYKTPLIDMDNPSKRTFSKQEIDNFR